MDHISEYVNTLTVQEMINIIESHENTISRNWCITESTPYILHTMKMLDFMRLKKRIVESLIIVKHY